MNTVTSTSIDNNSYTLEPNQISSLYGVFQEAKIAVNNIPDTSKSRKPLSPDKIKALRKHYDEFLEKIFNVAINIMSNGITVKWHCDHTEISETTTTLDHYLTLSALRNCEEQDLRPLRVINQSLKENFYYKTAWHNAQKRSREQSEISKTAKQCEEAFNKMVTRIRTINNKTQFSRSYKQVITDIRVFGSALTTYQSKELTLLKDNLQKELENLTVVALSTISSSESSSENNSIETYLTENIVEY